MKPKGVENAESVLAACREAAKTLGPSGNDEWIATLESIAQAIESLQSRFFLKTNPAIPATKACRADAEELAGLAGNGHLDQVPAVLERFKVSMEKLLKAANMEGIIIT
jgi:hypothetical protein